MRQHLQEEFLHQHAIRQIRSYWKITHKHTSSGTSQGLTCLFPPLRYLLILLFSMVCFSDATGLPIASCWSFSALPCSTEVGKDYASAVKIHIAYAILLFYCLIYLILAGPRPPEIRLYRRSSLLEQTRCVADRIYGEGDGRAYRRNGRHIRHLCRKVGIGRPFQTAGYAIGSLISHTHRVLGFSIPRIRTWLSSAMAQNALTTSFITTLHSYSCTYNKI